MKSIKKALIFISVLIFSSCDGVLFDDITYVDYTVHPVPYRPIPFHQGPVRRFEPVQRIPHNSIPPRVQRSGPQGATRSGRGFNRH